METPEKRRKSRNAANTQHPQRYCPPSFLVNRMSLSDDRIELGVPARLNLLVLTVLTDIFESHELLRLCSIATVIFDPLKRSSSPPSTFPRYISRGVQPRQHHREIQFFVSFNSVLFLRSVLALLRSEITLSINSVHFLLSALSSPSPSPPPPPPPLLRPIFSIVRFSTLSFISVRIKRSTDRDIGVGYRSIFVYQFYITTRYIHPALTPQRSNPFLSSSLFSRETGRYARDDVNT